MNITTKIKNAVRKWLGISGLDKQVDSLERSRIKTDSRVDKLEELSLIGVDLGVSERSDSYIIVATKLKGGVVKIIPMAYHRPDEVLSLMKELESRYRVREVIKDFPRGTRLDF